MKKFFSFFFLVIEGFFCFSEPESAKIKIEKQGNERQSPSRKPEIEKYFEKNVISFADYEVPYRLRHYFSTESKNEKPALFVFLHGSSGRGSDNSKQLNYSSISELDEFLSKNKINAFVLAPQCPLNHKWNETSTKDGSENIIDKIFVIIDTLRKQYQVDKTRVYLLGTSMGAKGAWRLLSLRPDFFSAAQIASGAPEADVSMENIKNTPVYFSLGENDYDSYNDYKNEVLYLEKNCIDFKFVLFPGLSHREHAQPHIHKTLWLFYGSIKDDKNGK